MIRVEYSSDVLGNGVFWEGLEENVSEILNIPARRAAELVKKDGEPRRIGMWYVRKIDNEEASCTT